jgi:hypothetical protein
MNVDKIEYWNTTLGSRFQVANAKVISQPNPDQSNPESFGIQLSVSLASPCLCPRTNQFLTAMRRITMNNEMPKSINGQFNSKPPDLPL